MLTAALSLVLLELPLLSAAYSWNFQSPPQQCSNLTIQVNGGGTPPYRVLIIPFGPSPLPNNIEVRKIVDTPFDGNSNSVSFKLNYPANSQLVAVVSDATGFGSGGTSVAALVTSSSDTSCFDPTKNVSPDFTFSIFPENQIVQCVPTRIFWNNSLVQGTPNFLGVIPGGESFAIPESNINTNTSGGTGTGFSWTPSIRGGTTLIIVGGDNRGNGTAGSVLNTVESGTGNINTCLNNASPSSTPGTPAGGSYPTGSNGAGTGGSSNGNNVGAIVGGVVGGIVVLAAVVLVLLFFRRRQRYHRYQQEKPVDLLVADEGDDAPPRPSRNELPQYYQPEPFVVPEPASTLPSDTATESDLLRQSFLSAGDTDLLSTSAPSTSTKKTGYQPRQMRPVNIIQHDDAGPSMGLREEEPETIELPPAYTNIRKPGGQSTPSSETAPTQPTTAPPTATETLATS